MTIEGSTWQEPVTTTPEALTADAGPDVVGRRGEETRLEGGGSGGSGALSYRWRIAGASHAEHIMLGFDEGRRNPRRCEPGVAPANRQWPPSRWENQDGDGTWYAFLGDADRALACFTVPRRKHFEDRSAVDDGQYIDVELKVIDETAAEAVDSATLTIGGTTWGASAADGPAGATPLPSLPIIARLLLAGLLAAVGLRQYGRRRGAGRTSE